MRGRRTRPHEPPRIHCPKPGTETPDQKLIGLIGCGSADVIGPDQEGLYDCRACGLWFTRVEVRDHDTSA